MIAMPWVKREGQCVTFARRLSRHGLRYGVVLLLMWLVMGGARAVVSEQDLRGVHVAHGEGVGRRGGGHDADGEGGPEGEAVAVLVEVRPRQRRSRAADRLRGQPVPRSRARGAGRAGAGDQHLLHKPLMRKQCPFVLVRLRHRHARPRRGGRGDQARRRDGSDRRLHREPTHRGGAHRRPGPRPCGPGRRTHGRRLGDAHESASLLGRDRPPPPPEVAAPVGRPGPAPVPSPPLHHDDREP